MQSRRRLERAACRGIVCLFVLGTLAISPLSAQRLRVRAYSEGEGLPSSAVRHVAQDRDGLMWFATRSGIASYDGTEWQTYDASEGLSALNQLALSPGIKTGMWSLAARTPLRVFRFEDGGWTVLPTPPRSGTAEPTSMEVYESNGRSIVAVGSTQGLFLWDGAWKRLDDTAGLPGSDVRALEVIAGRLFIGTTAGLASLADDVVQDLTERLAEVPSLGVYGLAASPDDNSLWIGGDSWLGRLDTDDRFVVEGRFEEPLAVDYFGLGATLDADIHGGVYFGNPAVLRYFHPKEGFTAVDRDSGLTNGGATHVFIDRENNTWVSGLRGVDKIVSRRFLTLREEHGLLENEVSAVIERRDGSFLLGHPNGLSILNGDTIQHVRSESDRRDAAAWGRVLDFEEDRDGRVWMAASWRGLATVDQAGVVEWFDSPQHGLEGKHVTSVRTTDDGRVWVTTNDLGLLVRDRGRFIAVPGLEEKGPRRLFRSSTGGLYVATANNGVVRIENGTVTGLAVGVKPEQNNVYAVLDDLEESTFVGTEAGLMVLDGDRLIRPSNPALQIKRPVYSLVRDSDRRLWCGTDQGVLRWDGAHLRQYSVAQGLAGPETNRAGHILDSHGRMWVGTTHGVSIYREDWDTPSPVAPHVAVESVLADGDRFPVQTDLDLGPHANDLTFDLRALSFVDEDRILIHSRLEGLDEKWSVTSGPSRRELRYLHVPPGRYRIQVQAESVDGARSKIYSSAWITVAAPFLQRPIVLAFAATLALLLLYFGHRYLAQRAYARELESEVGRRTAHIRAVEEELTRSRRLESLASFAGGVAHDFNNLLSVILGNLSILRHQTADTKSVDRAEEAVVQATKLTGQFLTFARGGTPVRSVTGLEDIVREAADLVLAGKNVYPMFDMPEDLPCADVDAGQMAQVFNNLLLNAIQAMPDGGRIRVSASSLEHAPAPLPPGRAIQISVEDEGPGISAAEKHRVFDAFFTTKDEGQGLGLASAYSIVNRHGGLLRIGESSGPGARFDVILMATDRQPEVESQAPATPAPSSGRILVMDDDDHVREVLKVMLEGMGYSVACTNDGESALSTYSDAVAHSIAFDAVILDLTVRGGMGGAEAIERLKAIDPEVEAIVISGYSENPVMAEPRRYGFSGAIAKPFRPDELSLVLKQVLTVEH